MSYWYCSKGGSKSVRGENRREGRKERENEGLSRNPRVCVKTEEREIQRRKGNEKLVIGDDLHTHTYTYTHIYI